MQYRYSDRHKYKYRATPPDFVEVFKDGKPWTRGDEYTTNRRDLNNCGVPIPKEFLFNSLEGLLAPWRFWVDSYNETEKLRKETGHPTLDRNYRIVDCRVTKKSIIVEWGWTENDKQLLEEMQCDPYEVTFKMTIKDVKVLLNDFTEIPKNV